MMPASIAWSSRQMGSLLEWRNRPSYRAGRIFATQLTLPLLTLAATVEMAVALVLWPIHRTRCGSLLSPSLCSAYFAIQWSLVSLGTNLLCARRALPTEERAARMQIGGIWHWRFVVAITYAIGTDILMNITVPPLSVAVALLVGYLAMIPIVQEPRRAQDYRNIQRELIELWGGRLPAQINDRIEEPRFSQLEPNREFFNELMNPQAFSVETRQEIDEGHWSIFSLLLTRAIYLYAYGSYRNAPLPAFLNAATNALIEQLRARIDLSPETQQAIEARLRELNFNEINGQESEALLALIRAGLSVLQGNDQFFQLIREQQQANQRDAA